MLLFFINFVPDPKESTFPRLHEGGRRGALEDGFEYGVGESAALGDLVHVLLQRPHADLLQRRHRTEVAAPAGMKIREVIM